MKQFDAFGRALSSVFVFFLAEAVLRRLPAVLENRAQETLLFQGSEQEQGQGLGVLNNGAYFDCLVLPEEKLALHFYSY
ncbi:uncharacterized protein P884DRAFT_264473 [Thermothelomyces heterothallicus CBS 202.75]|uniref:uncharacterized protein n=1 Tax=Thermothelomyces heterothallicus CBS 202.75 TaxID=1149848 RepID=UPI0037433C07